MGNAEKIKSQFNEDKEKLNKLSDRDLINIVNGVNALMRSTGVSMRLNYRYELSKQILLEREIDHWKGDTNENS